MSERPASVVERMPGDRVMLALAGCYYLIGAFVLTWNLWRDPAVLTVSGDHHDTDLMMWALRHDATAVSHGHLPALITSAINAPRGVNVMWNTFLLLPGVLLTPVTVTAGPQFALVLLLMAGFAGSAFSLAWVLRRWGTGLVPAVLAGAGYGFAPALLHSALGHYDLQLALFPPLIADAVLRLAAGRGRPWRNGLYLGVAATAQLFTDEELLLDTAIAMLPLLAVLAFRYRGQVRARLRPAAAGSAVAALAVAALAGFPVWTQFFGPLHQSGSPFLLDYFKADLTGLVTPSRMLLLHTAGSGARAAGYQGGASEYLGYLGIPLLLILAAGSARFWRRPAVAATAVAFLVIEVLSLGGTLLAAGHDYQPVKLPWYWLQGLPLFQSVLTTRFAIIAAALAMTLLAQIIHSILAPGLPQPASSATTGAGARIVRHAEGWGLVRAWRRGPGPGGRVLGARARMGLAGAVVIAGLAPLIPRPLPASGQPPAPAGWAAALTALRLHGAEHVLTVPVPTPTLTGPLRWQADTGQPASLVGGYFIGPAWNGHAYVGGDGTPAASHYLNWLWRPSGAAPVVTSQAMRQQLSSWRVSGVLAVTYPGTPLASYLTGLLGQPAVVTGAVMAWRVRP